MIVEANNWYNNFRFDIDGGYFISTLGRGMDFVGEDGINYPVLENVYIHFTNFH